MDPAADRPQAFGSLAGQQHLREVTGAAVGCRVTLAGILRLCTSRQDLLFGVSGRTEGVRMKSPEDFVSLFS